MPYAESCLLRWRQPWSRYAVQVPAYAADEDPAPTETGGDVTSLADDVPAEMQAQAAAKMAVASAYVEAKYESGDVAVARRLSRRYATPYGGRSALPMSVVANGRLALAAREQKWLDINHAAQNKDYFCGPASGRMILGFENAGDSAYNGSTLSQGHVAGPAHMRTEINQVTRWADGLFRVGVNRWLSGTSSGYYVDLDTPSPTAFENALVYDIDNNYPLAADTVEMANDAHCNGHPATRTIGHWIVAKAYYNSGNSVRFMDPSTSVYPNANEMFDANTANFANTYLQNNGITW